MKYSTFKNFEKIYSYKLKELIGSDLFLEAIQEFKKEVSGLEKIESDLTLMENRFHRIQNDFKNKLLSVPERSVELTRLAKAYLDYVDEFKSTYQIHSNNKKILQDESIETIKQIIVDKLGEKEIETDKIIIVEPHDIDFWSSGVEPFDPISNSSRYIAFWLLMKKSDKRFAIYSPDIISIGTLAKYLASVTLPHMSDLNYNWRLKRVINTKEKKVDSWLSLKVCAIKNGDGVYLSGKYSPPKPSSYSSGPKPGFPKKADPSMLSSRN